eukprot:4086320-Prymnesium_polylepis.1
MLGGVEKHLVLSHVLSHNLEVIVINKTDAYIQPASLRAALRASHPGSVSTLGEGPSTVRMMLPLGVTIIHLYTYTHKRSLIDSRGGVKKHRGLCKDGPLKKAVHVLLEVGAVKAEGARLGA